MEINDRECVRKALEGDKDAYGALIDAYKGMVFGVALNITGNYSDSEDIVQEAFLRAYEKLRTLSDPSKFAKWLYGLTRNLALQVLRQRRQIAIPTAEYVSREQANSYSESPAEAYARKELSTILWDQAALPTGGIPPAGIIESIAPKLHLPLMGLSAKKIIIITGVVLLGLISVLTLRHYQSRPPSSQPPPLIMEQEDVGDVAEMEEIKETPGQAINGTQIPEADLVRHSINGRVLEKGTNFPILGVIVVLNREGKAVKNSVTDQQGAFSLSNLADGRYELALQATDESVKENYYIPSDGKKVRVNLSGQDVDNLTLTLSRSTYISGEVVDQDRKPIKGATLRLEFSPSMLPYSEIQSDANGMFRFLGLCPGREYTLICEAPGFTKARARLTANIDKPVEGLTIQLFSGRVSISGYVINKEGEPLEHILVQAVSSSIGTMGAHEAYYALTGPEGIFSFHDVAPGEVTIETALNRNFSVKLNAKPNDAIENVEIVVNWDVREGYVAGVVIDEASQPVTQGFLYAYHKKENPVTPPIGVTIPNEMGEFKIANLEIEKPVDIFYSPSFRYRIGYSGWERKANVGDIHLPADTVIVVVQRDEQIDISFPKDVCIIYGRVLDKETGQPIEQFDVAVSFSRNKPEREHLISFSDAQGQFETGIVKYIKAAAYEGMMDFLVAEGIYLYVEADGYQGQWEKVVPGEGMKQAFVTILLDRGLSLQGRVVNLQNDPIEDAMVFVEHQKEHYVFTDSSGEFTLSNLRPSKRAGLHVSHPEYVPFRGKPFNFDRDMHDYLVQLSKGGTITGGVVDQEGKGIIGAELGIKGDKYRFSARTGKEGLYMVEHIPAGRCDVTLQVPTERNKIAWVEEGKVTVVDFGVSDSTLYGTVFLGDKPLASAKVNLKDQLSHARNRQSTQTDSNGRYVMSCIVAGQYYIRVSHDSTFLIMVPIDIPENERIQKDIVIRLGGISGYVVRGEDRSPVRDATVRLYPIESVLGRSFSHVIIPEQAIWAIMEADADGYFEFDCLAAGEYLVQAESNKLGQALAKVRVEPNKLTNIVLAFEQTGSLRLTTVDANTREGLSIKSILLLRDTNGWITPRSFTTPMPVTVNSINAGVYAIALLSEYEGRVYICNFQNGISIEPDKVTLVTLRMRQAVEFGIDVLDAQHKPVGGFECFLYDPEDSPLLIIEVNGCSIAGVSPVGDVRLVLTKNGKTIYDDYVQVTLPDGERIFQTHIVVE